MTETVREVPLSLQVFHSHNEYKAHRRNRTEQIYLRDLSAGLGREEKLYAKEYAFQRSSFHRHYARRFSAPLLSAPSFANSRAATAPASAIASAPGLSTYRQSSRSGTSSACVKNNSGIGGDRPRSQLSPRASVFSVSASLRHVTPSTNSSSASMPLAAKMLDGLKEMSVSTRFQRIQRKFSIASMTEHGCLTAEGNSLANDIQEARKRLFKQGYSGKSINARRLLVKSDSENIRQESMSKVEEEEEETREGEAEDTRKDNDCSKDAENRVLGTKDDNTSNDIVRLQDQNINDHAETLNKCSSLEPNDSGGEQTKNSKRNVTDPRMKMPFLKLRANLNFSKQRNSRTQGHVSIAEPLSEVETTHPDEVEEDHVTPEEHEQEPEHELLSQQTASIFKRFLSNTPYTEPLQLKIQAFLQDQAKFNHRFPKGKENSIDQSERHKELLNGEKEKKERLQREQEKKKEIVFEVLTKLGITDEQIWFHYNQS